jgi:hypothetical protein
MRDRCVPLACPSEVGVMPGRATDHGPELPTWLRGFDSRRPLHPIYQQKTPALPDYERGGRSLSCQIRAISAVGAVTGRGVFAGRSRLLDHQVECLADPRPGAAFAVAQGRCDLVIAGVPDPRVDGRWFCDQPRCARSGHRGPAHQGVRRARSGRRARDAHRRWPGWRSAATATERQDVDAESLRGAWFVRDRYRWHEVVRVNARTVTVRSDYRSSAASSAITRS